MEESCYMPADAPGPVREHNNPARNVIFEGEEARKGPLGRRESGGGGGMDGLGDVNVGSFGGRLSKNWRIYSNAEIV